MDGSPRLLGLVELILKDRGRLNRLIRDPALAPLLLPKFLAVALAGFMLYGVAMAIVIHSAGVWPSLIPMAEQLASPRETLIVFRPLGEGLGGSPWLNGAALDLVLAYSLGLIAATGVCLPSLYFYGLLSGIRMSMLDVTVHALKAKATSAVALVGILPIYVALGIGISIFPWLRPLLSNALLLGLLLPFIAGMWGVRSLYVGFIGLADTLPPERRCRRECFLRRLVLSWSAVYTAVSPVMILTLWEYLSR